MNGPREATVAMAVVDDWRLDWMDVKRDCNTDDQAPAWFGSLSQVETRFTIESAMFG